MSMPLPPDIAALPAKQGVLPQENAPPPKRASDDDDDREPASPPMGDDPLSRILDDRRGG